jgi:hypothetical protein
MLDANLQLNYIIKFIIKYLQKLNLMIIQEKSDRPVQIFQFQPFD